jgi:hypothetical protein
MDCNGLRTLKNWRKVKVHKKDRNMDYESTYGEDPRNIPGQYERYVPFGGL